MSGPLRMSFDVACSVEHAFTVWTSRIGTWWPPDHTVAAGRFWSCSESGVGGRTAERGAPTASSTTGVR